MGKWQNEKEKMTNKNELTRLRDRMITVINKSIKNS